MKKALSMLILVALCCGLTACTGDGNTSSQSSAVTSSAASQTEVSSEASSEASTPAAKPTTDPSGAQVSIPEEIDSIVVLSPSAAEMVVALGCGDDIVAYDTQSTGLEGLPTDVPVLDMMQPDMEQLAALQSDVLLVSNMTLYDQTNPYQQLIDMGVCVLCIPSASSIEEIQNDITFMAAAMGEEEKGEEILSQMQAELDRIAAIGETITDKKRVYFEIGAAPDMYSFGTGVFLNEMIELIGAENALADQEGWIRVESETVVAANPDVILTNVNYIEDPVGEILSRSGWEGMTAIQNQQVYYIDNMASSLGNQNIVKALNEMAQAVYPEYYGE